jgi:hypothetical protein
LPSISKKVRWLASPTWSMSLVRRHFWQSASRPPAGMGSAEQVRQERMHAGGGEQHRGSPSAMREALGRMTCPRSAKKARNSNRSLSASTIPATVATSQL